ncbi:MAG: response regulator, partial [Magnetococcales bacterium]|nr:response regulator [Magnetococcales bacterium]
SVAIYQLALEKAARERADDLVSFYRARLLQVEREWDLQAQDFRVRLEYTRLLEAVDPRSVATLSNLNAFITIQGTDRRFQYLVIQDRQGNILFDFGQLSSRGIPGGTQDDNGHFLDPVEGVLYRVLKQPIWLGERHGTGELAVFFRMDNALLFQMGAPGLTLSLFHDGKPVASSAGQVDLDRLNRGASQSGAQLRRLPWTGEPHDPLQLQLEAPVKTLFSNLELTLGMSFIPVVDGLILWFALGGWLLRQTGRITALGQAVEIFAEKRRLTRGLAEQLIHAKAHQGDEIAGVAQAMNHMAEAIVQREQALLQTGRDLEQARHQAEEANRAKSQFLANMSHEIRTPMNAILGFTHLALEMELSSKLRDFLEKVDSSSTHLLTIINDLLDVSKIEAGRMELEQSEFMLDHVLEQASNQCVTMAENKGLEIVIGVASEVPSRLVGDALRLGQIISNLLANAVKFTEQGEIRLEVTLLEQVDNQVLLHFVVQDTGIGLREDQRERLFQPFTQADNSITRRFGGTGLGLTICRQLVEQMSGRIGVESVPGEGSTFWFTVRLLLAGAGIACPHCHGRRVLLADDLESARRLMGAMLASWGMRVLSVENGRQAIEAVQGVGPFDLVVLDWDMPEVDGVRAAREIVSWCLSSGMTHPPMIIMVTAFSREQVLEAAVDVPIAAVLDKPVTPSRLMEALALCDGHRPAVRSSIDVHREWRARLALLTGKRLLVVEDHPINQQVVQHMLEGVGIRFTLAANGREALDCLELQTFDGLLMDLHMPEMDGLEATRRLRRDPRFHDLPVIAMTAAAMEKDRLACLEAGMNDHVIKPIDKDHLIRVLVRWLVGEGAVPDVSPEPPSNRFAQVVDEDPWIDFAGAISRVGGDRNLWRELSLRFVEEVTTGFPELRQALQQQQWEDARRLAHRLRGAAANLGAVAMS